VKAVLPLTGSSFANGQRRRENHQTPSKSSKGRHKNWRTPYLDLPPFLARWLTGTCRNENPALIASAGMKE